MMISTDFGVWVAVFLTLCVWSYYFTPKQNVFFRFANATIIGATGGYIISIAIVKNLDSLVLNPIQGGNLLYIVPFLLGLLLYTRFIPRYSYLARIPIAIIVSTGLGLGSRAAIISDVREQILANIKLPFLGVGPFTAFSNIVLFIATFTTVFYFFFTLNPKMQKTLKPINTLGRYFLMVYFGANFANTVASRTSLFIGRAMFILYDFLGLAP